MKQLLILAAVCTLGFAPGFCSTANADFIIDDFSTRGNGAVTISGATISIAGGGVGGGGFVDNGSGYDIMAGLGAAPSITYDWGAQTIAETYAASAWDPNPFNTENFNLDVLTVPFDFGASVADWRFDLFLDGSATPFFTDASMSDYKPYFVNGTTFGNASSITLRFQYTGVAFPSPLGTFGGSNGNLIANPEPTSALLFGAVLGGVGLIRRRRS